MKKFRIILPVLLAAFLLPSCLDSDEADTPVYGAFVTLHVPETTSYYFSLDNKKTIHPGDMSRAGYYIPEGKDGRRAIVYFSLLGESMPGYDYNAVIYSISDVHTKEVETASTAEELAAFGDDCTDAASLRLSGEWLDILYNVPADASGKAELHLSLVDNKTYTPSDLPAGYTCLEFRCKAVGDTTGRLVQDYVSFRLGGYAPAASGAKGIYLRVKQLTGNVTYLKVEPAGEES